MKEENVKGVLIDVVNGTSEVKEVKDELREYYDVLGCAYIDIYRRKIGDIWYSVVCDDEGRLKDKPRTSGVDVNGRIAFVGNLFICSGNIEDGEMHSLTDPEIENLMENISAELVLEDGQTVKQMILFNIDYH